MPNGEQLKLQFQKNVGLLERKIDHKLFYGSALLFACRLALQPFPKPGFKHQELLLSQSQEYFGFAGKVDVERTSAPSRVPGNVFNAGRLETIADKDMTGRFQQSLAGSRGTK